MDNLDHIDEIAYTTLKNRQNILENTGHITDYKEQCAIVIVFINQFLYRFGGIFTNLDSTIIEKALSCITEHTAFVPNILIERPWYSYKFNVELSHAARITEDDILRLSDENIIRRTE